jgi:catechol 2,3-dioxygenase-like lactoylglutathione lyase family enzyme
MATNLGFDGGLTCALSCGDLQKSIAWYRDVLGFELLYRLDDMGWCELKSPVDRVNVGLSEVESPDVEGGATLTFGVTDIDAARADLESAKVRFDGETRTIPDMVKLATFFDPDGNKLMLYQDLQAASG